MKPGPLATPPPSAQEWKARGEKGEPPLPFEKVVRNTPSGDALEYLIYHGFVSQVRPREIERRIHELEEDRSRKNLKYNKAALYYLKKKLEQLIVGEADQQQ